MENEKSYKDISVLDLIQKQERLWRELRKMETEMRPIREELQRLEKTYLKMQARHRELEDMKIELGFEKILKIQEARKKTVREGSHYIEDPTQRPETKTKQLKAAVGQMSAEDKAALLAALGLGTTTTTATQTGVQQ